MSGLHRLAGELADTRFGQRKPLLAEPCCLVEFSGSAPFALHAGGQIALVFHGVQHRVERAGAEAVAVIGQFVDHPLAIDFVFRRVVQNMQPDKAGKEIVEFHHSSSCDSAPTSLYDIGNR